MRLLLPSLLFAGLAGLASLATAAEPVRIGQVASLTGKEAAFGQSSNKGTVLAIEEINAAGGILGRPVELITEDNRSTQGESATAARKLISRDRVVALLGEVASGRSMEMAPVAQRAKVPMVSPSSTNPRVTEMGNFIFRVCFIDPFQGEVLAKFSVNTLKAKRVAILADAAAPYSIGLAEAFAKAFNAAGGELVMERRYQGGDKDFRAQLTAIRGANPEAVFIPGYYTDVGLIAKQARQVGLGVPLFGGDGWEAPELLSIGGQAVEGSYYSTHFSPRSTEPAVEAFVARFKERWKGETPDAMAALGYDSAKILARAIETAGSTDGAAIREALASIRDFPGVTGVTSIDESRNARKAAVIIAVRNGSFDYVETVAP
jgi:branched-chain amino acid transport system substrate-binding protein